MVIPINMYTLFSLPKKEIGLSAKHINVPFDNYNSYVND